MPTYSVYVKYTIEDHVTIDAADEWEARDLAESDPQYDVITNGGYAAEWDAIEAYEVEVQDEN